MKLRTKKRKSLQPHQTNLTPSPQQQAQLNLIEISNYDILPTQRHNQPEALPKFRHLQKTQSLVNQQRNRVSPLKNFHESIELKGGSVAAKVTQTYRSARKSSSPQISTDKVCVIKTKMPLSLSNFILTGHVNEPKYNQKFQIASLLHRPCRSIKMKAYFKKRQGKDHHYDINQTQNLIQNKRYQGLKLNPIQQSYWKIFRGVKTSSKRKLH